jgi:phthiocerol/phenolphthiocerol synthesis type-I polyketide synthase C
MQRDDGGRATLLGSLGTLYTLGQPIAWEQLYPWGGRCVAAPTYPWQRQRYWLDTAAATTASTRRGAGHRLPTRGPLRSSVDPQTVFVEIDIGTELMPVLKDHRVHGAPILPATALLELVLTATADAFGAGRRALRDVVFHRSLVLADDQPHTVQLVLTGEPPDAVSFECNSMEPGTAGSPQWSLLASGTLAPGEPTTADDECHAPELTRTRCPEAIPGSSFYSRLAEHGLEYGPAFRAVEEVWRRDGEALARLRPPVEGSSAVDADDFDAPLLDACLQVLAATLPARNGHSHDTYLPVGVAEVLSDGTSTGGVWCRALLRGGPDPEPDTIEGDVFLLREDGQVAVAVRGLRLQRMPGKPATEAADLHDWLYELRWEPATLSPDASSRPVDAGSWLMFSDGGATSDMLRRRLEEHSQTCVLVEPGVDFTRLGPHGYRLDPAQPQHFRRLLDEVFGENLPPCRGVVHMWSLMAAPPAQTSTDSLESSRVHGAASVLHLVQALTLADRADTPRLWLVTRGAQAVGTHDQPVSIAQAPLWGMGRSIHHEHPELRCTRVDLPSGGDTEEVHALFGELWADPDVADVALRDGRRYVARMVRHEDDGGRRQPTPAPDTDVAFRMEYPQPGGLDDIRARADARRSPEPEEVEIRVHATGLNFIDAMRALGVYPGQDDGPVRVGIECSGIVTAVGDGVSGLHVGDAVIALAMDGVGSYVTTPACLVAAKPAHLRFEAAAAIPIPFLTAYYSLHEQARLRHGERVLIHSAAGGVGLAAVEVARWLGAKVYATAGTPEKRDHLRALGVEHISDSRSLAFADELLAATEGEGVDVVLNSLTGEAIGKGLAALRPYGRFVEIGKRDIYQHGRLRMWQLRRNASYMVIDLAQLVIDRPACVGELLRDVVSYVGHEVFRPLPVRTFPVAETAAAVRCLARGKQIGKVVVSVGAQLPSVVEPAEPSFKFRAEATYLITGGLGGIGSTVAAWMAAQGARHLVLMGRGRASKAARDTLDALRAEGAEVVVAQGDVTRADELAAVLESIRVAMPPLRGVVHSAGVLDDGILRRLDERRLRDVMAPKVDGAWNLHALTRDTALDFFVLFSSAASILGSPGQSHYAAANAFLDALAWHRRAEGLPALSINWGPWAEVGLATRPEQQRHLAQHGIEPIPAADGIRTLSYLLRRSATQVAVLRMAPAAGDTKGRDASLSDALRRAGPDERRPLLESYLRDQAAGKLGLTPSGLDMQLPLNRLGVDSLIAVELRTQIERDLGIVVPVVQMLDGPSVAGLAGWLCDRFCGADTAEPDPTSAADTLTALPGGVPDPTDVAPSPWMDLLAQVPEASDGDVDELLRTVLAAKEAQQNG